MEPKNTPFVVVVDLQTAINELDGAPSSWPRPSGTLYAYVPLNSGQCIYANCNATFSSIIWYRSGGDDAVRLPVCAKHYKKFGAFGSVDGKTQFYFAPYQEIKIV